MCPLVNHNKKNVLQVIGDFEARLAHEQAGAEHKFGTLYPGRIVELELVHGHKLVQKSARIINASNRNSILEVKESACQNNFRNGDQNGAMSPKITEKESRYNVVVLDIQEDQHTGLQDCCVFLVPQASFSISSPWNCHSSWSQIWNFASGITSCDCDSQWATVMYTKKDATTQKTFLT